MLHAPGMKYAFKIKTEPTLHAAEDFAVVITSSGALATIAVSLNNPPIAIYCITILALIIWIALMKMHHMQCLSRHGNIWTQHAL